MDTFKLQKLVYYSQAWHRVWNSKSMFTERIVAWAGGPVVPTLYSQHRSRFSVSEWNSGDLSRLTAEELEAVDSIVDTYGDLAGYQFRQLTHSEAPWIVLTKA
ncbi:MAG: Panacea domain-containing protein [Ferrimicrobium sp.]